MRRVPTHLPGMLTRDEFVAAYAERTGRTVTPEQWRFYEVFGLFRMAVIAQQIYYRYFHGQTTNEMYALFGPAVQIIGRRLDGLHRRVSSILLVRHGQASFGAADYDNLSPVGHEQSRVLGAALAARGVAPDLVVAGEMRRHAQTAAALLDGAGWSADVSVDAGWNEFDHLQVLGVHDSPDAPRRASRRRRPSSGGSRRRRGAGRRASTTRRTTSRSAPSPRRVDAALARLVDALPAQGHRRRADERRRRSRGSCAALLADDTAARTDLWLRLNPVSINTGTSTIVRGGRGTTLVAFNAHDHLSPDLLTYR